MTRKPSRTKCPTCGEAGIKKNGTTSKGLQRYRCTYQVRGLFL
ncbi:transposase-like zinc-binding domain-containing protein [Alloscardovia sp. HMSC034E08]